MTRIRRVNQIWGTLDAAGAPVVAATGAGGKSNWATVGAAEGVTIFISVSGATTIGIEASAGSASPARNDIAAGTIGYPVFKQDGSGALQFVFAGAGTAALNLSPFAPEHVRLSSTNNINAYAFVDAI